MNNESGSFIALSRWRASLGTEKKEGIARTGTEGSIMLEKPNDAFSFK
jgi:hypothetical protein